MWLALGVLVAVLLIAVAIVARGRPGTMAPLTPSRRRAGPMRPARMPQWSDVWVRAAGESDAAWTRRAYQYLLGAYQVVSADSTAIRELAVYAAGLQNLGQATAGETLADRIVTSVCKGYATGASADTPAKRALLARLARLCVCAPTPRAINAPIAPAPLDPARPTPAPLDPARPAPAPLDPARPAPAPLDPARPKPAPLDPARPKPQPGALRPASMPQWSEVWQRAPNEADAAWGLRVYQFIIGGFQKLQPDNATVKWLSAFLAGQPDLGQVVAGETGADRFVANVCRWYLGAGELTPRKRALIARAQRLLVCEPAPRAINTPRAPRWDDVWRRDAGESDLAWSHRIYQHLVGPSIRVAPDSGGVRTVAAVLAGLQSLTRAAALRVIESPCYWVLRARDGGELTPAQRAALLHSAHMFVCAAGDQPARLIDAPA